MRAMTTPMGPADQGQRPSLESRLTRPAHLGFAAHPDQHTTRGSSMDAGLGRTTGTATSTDGRAFARRVSTETKASYKTTELIAYVVVFAGILLAKSGSREPYDDDRR
jgi:hypothetical protein